MASRPAAGFTLIELLVTIGIAAILLMLALPSFTDAIRNNRVTTSANQMMATLNFARAEAMRSKNSAHVCPSNANGTACGDEWKDGILVWVDENGKGFEATEIRRVIEAQKGIDFKMETIVGKEIVFDDRGRVLGRKSYDFALQAAVCKPGAKTRRNFSISRVGRVVLTRGDCQ